MKSKSGKATTVELGYLGAGGFHLQRSHLINNAQPGAGLIQPRRPHPKISFVANTVFPSTVTVASSTFPVSTINLLENTSQSWYDAGYVNVRQPYSNGPQLPGQLHVCQVARKRAGLSLADVRGCHAAEQRRPECGERAWLRHAPSLCSQHGV